MPAPCHEVDDLFGMVILLNPQEDSSLELQLISSGGACHGGASLRLDPTTMMVKEN